MKEIIKKYQNKFSEIKLWSLLKNSAKKIGLKSVYSALLLFYAYRRKETPTWAKRIILGTLGYLLAPFDMVPDLSPIIGFTDDVGILSFGLVTIAAFINDDVKGRAKDHLKKWFGEYDETELESVDAKL